jgi:hypothetical protein
MIFAEASEPVNFVAIAVAAIGSISTGVLAWMRLREHGRIQGDKSERAQHKKDKEIGARVAQDQRKYNVHLFAEYKEYIEMLKSEKDRIEKLYVEQSLRIVELEQENRHLKGGDS